MADQFGYSTQFTDRPGTWTSGGKVDILDGYAGDPSLNAVPSGVVKEIRYISTGKYSILLKQNWYKLVDATITSQIPAGLTPAVVGCQLLEDTVGVTGEEPQRIDFQFYQPSDMAAINLPTGAGFRYMLTFQNTQF